eukprot:7545833-Lingulodinium_polyedra.AAC.1
MDILLTTPVPRDVSVQTASSPMITGHPGHPVRLTGTCASTLMRECPRLAVSWPCISKSVKCLN